MLLQLHNMSILYKPMYSTYIQMCCNKLLIPVLNLEMQVHSYNSISRIPLTLRHTVKVRVMSLLRSRFTCLSFVLHCL